MIDGQRKMSEMAEPLEDGDDGATIGPILTALLVVVVVLAAMVVTPFLLVAAAIRKLIIPSPVVLYEHPDLKAALRRMS